MGSKDTQFKSGHSGGPGRPKGVRNKFSEAYVNDIFASWKENGKKVIDKVIREHPDVYLRIVSQLISKDIDVKQSGDITIQIVSYKDMYKDKSDDKSADSLETEEHPELTLIEGSAKG